MKVAVNTRFLLSGKLEGIGWFSYEILKRLVQNHPEVTFYFLFDRPWDKSFVFGPNVIPVKVFPPARHPILFYAWFEYAVPAVLNRIKPDVFMSTDGFLSLKTPFKTLLWWHDITYKYFSDTTGSIQQAYYSHFVPKFLKRANRIITFSGHAASELVSVMKIPKSKITVSAGAPRQAFQPLSHDEQASVRARYTHGCPYFLYAGAIQPRKNIANLILAFDQFKQEVPSDFKLLLAGRLAWKFEGILKAYNKAIYKQDILFLGHLGDELPLLTSAAHALTYPSYYEGFGLPIIESVQCGVPVVTSNVSSMPEVCGNAGLLVPPHDVAAITEAMKRMATDTVLYKTLQQACRHQASKFSWDKTAIDVYQAIESTMTDSGLSDNDIPRIDNT